jgi:hypothetical protein
VLTLLVTGVVLLAAVACSSSKPKAAPPTTSTQPPGSVTTTTTADAQPVVFAATDGNIDAYLTDQPFTRQRVVAAGTGPDHAVPHGQVCFVPDGSRRFVIAETRTPDGAAPTAGWGLYQLTGDEVGSFRVRRTGGWDSPGAASADAPTTYGCAFLPDGRLLTTDVGNQRTGAPTGRLVEWFPPFDGATVTSCTIAGDLATPLGLSADADGGIYLASARAPTAGVWRYRGTFPGSANGCVTAIPEPADEPPPPSTTTTIGAGGPSSSTTVPSTPATPARVTAKLIVPGGTDGVTAPIALAVAPGNQGFVVTSAPDGLIEAFDLDGGAAQTILKPAAASPGTTTTTVAGAPLQGSPFGVVVSPTGAVIYTDIGLTAATSGALAPGDRAGALLLLDPSSGAGTTPTVIDHGLAAPDGLGLYVPGGGGGGAASKV